MKGIAMNTTWRRFTTALALALTLGACSDADPLMQSSASPSFSDGISADGQKWKIAKEATSGPGEKYKEVEILPLSSNPNQRSGTIGIDGHLIVIPEGAVLVPTLFTMKISRADSLGVRKILVELKAWQKDDKGDYKISVGHLGFLKPLPLRLSYDKMVDAVDPTRLNILWAKSSSDVEVQSTTLSSNGRFLEAKLTHFSPYAIGWPE